MLTCCSDTVCCADVASGDGGAADLQGRDVWPCGESSCSFLSSHRCNSNIKLDLDNRVRFFQKERYTFGRAVSHLALALLPIVHLIIIKIRCTLTLQQISSPTIVYSRATVQPWESEIRTGHRHIPVKEGILDG